MTTKTRAAAYIAYEPTTWNEAQSAMHQADSLELAFNHASCLAGGWYRRPVAIDFQVTSDNTERYMLRPADVPALSGWTPCYEVKRLESAE